MKVPIQAPTEEWPNRPDHLDFDILSALISTLDAEADDAGPDFDLSDVVNRYIDSPSLAYLALQRAIRVLGIKTRGEVVTQLDETMRLASVYHEGFVMGCRFQQTKGTTRNQES